MFSPVSFAHTYTIVSQSHLAPTEADIGLPPGRERTEDQPKSSRGRKEHVATPLIAPPHSGDIVLVCLPFTAGAQRATVVWHEPDALIFATEPQLLGRWALVLAHVEHLPSVELVGGHRLLVLLLKCPHLLHEVPQKIDRSRKVPPLAPGVGVHLRVHICEAGTTELHLVVHKLRFIQHARGRVGG